MKKLLAIILCLALTVSLCACGASSVKDDIEDALDKAESTLSQLTETKKLTRGTVTGNVYKSEFLDLTFTAPDSWVFSTDEELASSLGTDVSAFSDFTTFAETNLSCYDMSAKDINTNSNMILGYENLAKSNSTNITEKQYMDAVKNQLAGSTTMKTEFEADYATVKLGDNDYLRAICKTTSSGIEMTQIYYVRKVGKYIGFIIVTTLDGYTVSDVEAMFS